MTLSTWTLPGGLLLLASVLLLLWAAWSHRRHRGHLERLSRKYELARVHGEVSREVLRLAAPLEGPRGRVRLREVLMGHDSDGSWYIARRRTGRRSRQTLFFPLGAGPRLHGFRFAPEEGKGRGRERFAVHWSAGREQWLDEAALGLAARVLHHTARILEEGQGHVSQVELDGGRILLQGRGDLRGRSLESFLADATRLRRLLLQALRQTRKAASSAGVRPVKAATSSRSETVTLLRR